MSHKSVYDGLWGLIRYMFTDKYVGFIVLYYIITVFNLLLKMH